MKKNFITYLSIIGFIASVILAMYNQNIYNNYPMSHFYYAMAWISWLLVLYMGFIMSIKVGDYGIRESKSFRTHRIKN